MLALWGASEIEFKVVVKNNKILVVNRYTQIAFFGERAQKNALKKVVTNILFN